MITLVPTAGLSNRLRVIFSYLRDPQLRDVPVTIVWIKTRACNGYFLDYFQPIDNVTFVKKIPNGANIFYQGYYVHPEYSPDYSSLKLNEKMKKIIEEKYSKMNNGEYMAVHIRKTDLISLKKSRGIPLNTDQKYIDFLNLDTNKLIYLATDNHKTQKKFKKKFKKRIQQLSVIKPSKDLRQTSLKQAIIDIYLCVKAEQFMGTDFSSFTGIINNLRVLESLE